MADPISLRRPKAGRRYDPTAIDATGTTLGDVLTSVSDGSGGKRAGWAAGGGSGGGISSGTPGDDSIPIFHRTLIVDAANLTTGIVEQPEYKDESRKFSNWANVLKSRLQAVIKQAVASGKIGLQVSANGGVVWQWPNASGQGPFVSTAAVGYPVPGDWFDTDTGLKINNLVWRLVTVMPSGVVVPLEHGVVWLDTVSSASPPATTIPSDPVLPTDGGTTWGSPILDLYGNTLSADGFANLARAIGWRDLSASGFNSIDVPSGAGSVRSGGEYHESGWNGGAYPYVQVKPNDYGWRCGVPGGYAGHTTYYFLLDDITGAGTGNVGGNEAANIAASDEGGGSNFWLRIQSDGKVFVIAGANVFGSSSITGTTAVNDGLPHIIRLVHANTGGAMSLFVDGNLEGSVSGATGLVQPWTGYQYFGAGTDQTNRGTYKVQQIVRYNKDHGASGINAVETAIRARAGM